MRFFSFIPALAALVTVVAGASVPTGPCDSAEMGCETHDAPKREFIEHPARDGHAVTNAQLLRRGLPPKEPLLRRGSPVRRSNPSSVPPVKITHRGIIEVHSANGDLLGYVSKNLGNGGAQYVYNPSKDSALDVSFDTDATNSGSQLNINSANSNPAWPLLGLVQGRDDTDSNLAPGSYQYLYLGGVDSPGTAPGSPPSLIDNSYFIGSPRTAETAVWTFNFATGALTLQWINSDGSSPVIQTFTQSTGLYVTSDTDAFHARYPAPVTPVTYKFVSN